jgi:hypothetical protein
MSENSKISFKTIEVKPHRFLNVINPDTQIKNTDGILSYNTGIYGSKNDNAMPNFLIDIYENASAVHQNLVNLKSNLIIGNNVQAEDENTANLIDPFIRKRNKSGDNLKTIYAKASKDMALFNGCVLQVIYSREGQIAEIYHIPYQDFRLGIPNKYGHIEFGYISKNWGQISNSIEMRKKESVRLRMWSPDLWQRYPTQLLFVRDFGYNYYPTPAYNAAINWILIDRQISEFHKSNIVSGFHLAGMLTQLKSGMTDEQVHENANEIEAYYSGAKGRKILLSYVDQMSEKPVFDKFSGGDLDKMFSLLAEQCYQNIITGHNAYPILGGVDTKSADLGGSENKLNTALLAFNQLVCESMKNLIVDGFNKIMDVNNLPYVIVITEPLKITLPIAQPDDLTRTERREFLYGLPPIDDESNNVNPNQDPV